jgi:cobalt-zinc-cadmium efflux system protein
MNETPQHDHAGGHRHSRSGNLRFAFVLNLAFTVFEFLGGLWTNSVAIMSNALHDLSDSVSFGVALYLERVAQGGRSDTFSYGRRRFSLLGALINAITLTVGSLYVLSQAVPRLLHPEHSDALGMLGFAIVGVAVNGWAVLRVRRDSTMNARIVAWHLLEDVLGWVAVLVVAVVLMVRDLHILDPILSILITAYVLYNVVRNLRKTLALFLQATPEGVDLAGFQERIAAIDKVLATHHTHVWSLDGEHHVLTAHVVLVEGASKQDSQRVKREIRGLTSDMGLAHITVEIDFAGEDCTMSELEAIKDSETSDTAC